VPIAELRLTGSKEPVRILSGHLPANNLPLYLVDAPAYFHREGNPYTDVTGRDWGDNADRFALFCRAVVEVALGSGDTPWRADVVHCNDWQTGLIPPLLALQAHRPATVFTIHNLAYQGLFDQLTYRRLKLPAQYWDPQGLEFHHLLSFIKGGILFSDRVNTVSPTYANEVRTPRFGYGLDGLLRHLGPRFGGILNGIDYEVWDPAQDPLIACHYDWERFELKAENKRALQEEMGLPQAPEALLFGYIGRLVEQKGVDLILKMLPELLAVPETQLVMQGAGDPDLELALEQASADYPGRVAVHVGYDEGRAHRIEAGSDCFLMPSRFEPCGLNQLYSLRYGTIPIVHRTGGLVDTVIDTTPEHLQSGVATGFQFEHADSAGLWYATSQAIELRRRPSAWWHRLATAGMRQDFSWSASARHYSLLYQGALRDPLRPPPG
jgi:starch synthase